MMRAKTVAKLKGIAVSTDPLTPAAVQGIPVKWVASPHHASSVHHAGSYPCFPDAAAKG
jgi:hypothetical protein